MFTNISHFLLFPSSASVAIICTRRDTVTLPWHMQEWTVDPQKALPKGTPNTLQLNMELKLYTCVTPATCCLELRVLFAHQVGLGACHPQHAGVSLTVITRPCVFVEYLLGYFCPNMICLKRLIQKHMLYCFFVSASKYVLVYHKLLQGHVCM